VIGNLIITGLAVSLQVDDPVASDLALVVVHAAQRRARGGISSRRGGIAAVAACKCAQHIVRRATPLKPSGNSAAIRPCDVARNEPLEGHHGAEEGRLCPILPLRTRQRNSAIASIESRAGCAPCAQPFAIIGS